MSEKEYIERENLKKSLAYLINDFDNDGVIYGLKVAIQVLATQPTADVAEVKHGHWYLLDNCANHGVYCSVCCKKVYRDDYANQKIKSKYCPNCGAKMDGGKNGK